MKIIFDGSSLGISRGVPWLVWGRVVVAHRVHGARNLVVHSLRPSMHQTSQSEEKYNQKKKGEEDYGAASSPKENFITGSTGHSVPNKKRRIRLDPQKFKQRWPAMGLKKKASGRNRLKEGGFRTGETTLRPPWRRY